MKNPKQTNEQNHWCDVITNLFEDQKWVNVAGGTLKSNGMRKVQMSGQISMATP